MRGDLDLYRRVLEGLPGVQSFRYAKQGRGPDVRARLETEAGDREVVVRIFRSHLTAQTAHHIVSTAAASTEPVVIFAPHVGAGLAALLSEAGVNYVDVHGNCHLVLPPLFIHVEGKTGARRPGAGKGLRRPAYQVLFAYLAEPDLLDAPVRTVAERAGVSRQPVSDLRRRLLDDAYLLATKTKTRWNPRRRQDALDLWLHGYETIVRPSLRWGTYRTRPDDPMELERQLTQALAAAGVAGLRWGGTAAGFRITGHHRGPRTVAHVRAAPDAVAQRLHALSDPRGNLVLMDAFGTLNWQSGSDTVHPLLVYSETLSEGSERAREAARELYETRIRSAWEPEA